MTQVISSDLTFDWNSPVYGAQFLEYLGLVPTTASGEPYEVGLLHNGYTAAAGKPICAVTTPGGADTSSYCFMTRDVLSAAAGVRAYFRLHPITGFTTIADLGEWSLYMRVQGGTLAGNGTTSVRYEDVTCYQFRIYIHGLNILFETRKIVAGVATVLGSPLVLPGTSVINLSGQTLGFSFSALGTAPVQLRARGFVVNPATGLPITTSILLQSHSDSSSPISAAGRCGFGMGTGRAMLFGSGTDLCEVFEVQDENEAILVRDEWRRHAISSMTSLVSDSLGTSGKPLQSRFTRDQFFQTLLYRDTSAERLQVDLDSGGTNHAAAILCTRPATDPTRQHREAKYEIEDDLHDSIGVGIILYAAQSTAATSTTGELGFSSTRGYAVVCKHTASGDVYAITLYRYDVVGTPAKIAETSVAAPGAGSEPFPLGGTFTVALEAYPTDDQGGYPDASVTIKAYVDSVQVDFAPVIGSPVGIAVASDGTVTDGNSQRVKGGAGEGVYVSGASQGDLVWVDDWTENALHDPETPPDGQPTIGFADEGTATETLDDVLTPAWSVTVDEDAHTVSLRYESGHRYTAPRHTTPEGLLWARRRWKLNSPPLSKESRDALAAFYEARGGSVEAFNFTDRRSGESVKVHFVEDSAELVKRATGTYFASFDLEELV